MDSNVDRRNISSFKIFCKCLCSILDNNLVAVAIVLKVMTKENTKTISDVEFYDEYGLIMAEMT